MLANHHHQTSMKNSSIPGVRPLVPAPPVATSRPRRPKASKGWFTVQLPDRDLKLMRRLARETGVRFDLLMRGALFEAVQAMRAEHTLARRTGLPIDHRRRVFAYGGTRQRN